MPGVVRYNGAKVQLLDLPGIIEGAKDGKGRGRQVTTNCSVSGSNQAVAGHEAELEGTLCAGHQHCEDM